jgi:hypothetical protein
MGSPEPLEGSATDNGLDLTATLGVEADEAMVLYGGTHAPSPLASQRHDSAETIKLECAAGFSYVYQECPILIQMSGRLQHPDQRLYIADLIDQEKQTMTGCVHLLVEVITLP